MHGMSDRPAIDMADASERVRAPDLYEVSDLLTVREAADALAVGEPAIRRAIRRGELAASRHGRSFRITRAALDDFRAAREPTGAVAAPAPRRAGSRGAGTRRANAGPVASQLTLSAGLRCRRRSPPSSAAPAKSRHWAPCCAATASAWSP